ncbi:MAG: thiamine pyrophosphate-binding protein [Paracoccaceae bacterium]|nr:thiamine pyrophosphate-binding protein [Paracoccaceae bacterium]
MGQTVADLALESLIANGIDTLYCVPGYQNDPFFDALYHRQNELKPVQARHEQGAVYMALGAALATRRPQAFCVVPGPGFLNGSAALCTALSLYAPVFGLVGQIPGSDEGKGLGHLHEINDQIGIARSLTRHAVRITDSGAAAGQLRECWDALLTGPRGPVVAEIPVDLWRRENRSEPESPKGTRNPAPTPDAAALVAAAERITRSRSPLVVVGGGAQDHAESVRAFARCIGAGVIANRNGRGVMPSWDPLCLSPRDGHALWPECDLVIGLGTRLVAQKHHWGLDDGIGVLHIDIDAGSLARAGTPEIGLHADLAKALPELLALLPKQDERVRWRRRITEVSMSVRNRIAADLAPQLRWLRAIRDAMPDDAIFVDELTQIGYVARFAFPVDRPMRFLSTGYQGTLGWGIAAAVGAARACPNTPVVSIAGDGGALFTIAELATAVHHAIPVNVIVMNDNAYGNVQTMQREDYGARYIASDLTSPDFVALARSFGVHAERAETPEDLNSCLRTAIALDGPCLIEVPVGPFPSPWKHILLGRVRGDSHHA